MTTKEAKESVLELQARAALGGHDLGPFALVEVLTGGYEARMSKLQPIRLGRGFWLDVLAVGGEVPKVTQKVIILPIGWHTTSMLSFSCRIVYGSSWEVT